MGYTEQMSDCNISGMGNKKERKRKKGVGGRDKFALICINMIGKCIIQHKTARFQYYQHIARGKNEMILGLI